MSGTGADAWPDLAGRLERVGGDGTDDGVGDPVHVLPVRVYFEDTDFSGVVYHASYVRWCERGRSDFLRLLGNDHRALIAGDAGHAAAAFVVRRMSLEFLAPARIDDVLEVRTSAREIGAASITLDQRIARDGKTLFEARVLVVLVSQTGKPMRISSALRRAFSS
ncbi:MAG: YbgC/FadM family acyl-CoA thioesterase [Pseudomonadota bacterium]